MMEILGTKNSVLETFYEIIYCEWNGIRLTLSIYEWIKTCVTYTNKRRKYMSSFFIYAIQRDL